MLSPAEWGVHIICSHLHLCGPLMRRTLLESLPHRANDISMRKWLWVVALLIGSSIIYMFFLWCGVKTWEDQSILTLNKWIGEIWKTSTSNHLFFFFKAKSLCVYFCLCRNGIFEKACTMQITVSFVSPSRGSVFLDVNCISETIWKIPIDLIATEPLMANVLIIESTEVGKMSAVGFHLTSTTRCVCPPIFFPFVHKIKVKLLY